MAETPPPSEIVVDIYKGVKVRRCNRIVLLFGEAAFKKIIDAASDTNLSIHKILSYSGQPCERCKNTNVTFLDKDGLQKEIKRGLMYMPESNGIGITQRAKNKINKDDKSH